MRAAVMDAFRQPLQVRDIADPSCPDDGVIVQVGASGICRSDWHVWQGHWPLDFPVVMGHEIAGHVVAVGRQVRRARIGDRVVVPFCGGCGVCDWCIEGHQHICDDPWVPGFSPEWPGGFGALVPVAHADINAIALPEAVSFVAAAGMGCRYMTAWHGLVDRGRIRPGEWLAIYGCGGVGLSAVQIANALGANAIAVDLDPAKLEMAQALGAAAVVNARGNDPVEAVRDLTGGGAHMAVDALGLAETCRNALLSLRKRGRHIQIGISTEADRDGILLPTDRILGQELELIGSYGMPLGGYRPLFSMVESGRLAPEQLVTRRVGVEEVSPVLESMGAYDTRGIVVITSF